MKIRKATIKDAEEIRRVALTSWMFAYKDIYKKNSICKMVFDYYSDKKLKKDFDKVKNGDAEFVVALSSNKIIGYAQAGFEKKRWEVLRIYVEPKFSRKGIGTKLLKKIEAFLRKKKASSYLIYPHSKNKIAVNFYNKYGFVREPKLDRGKTSPCYLKRLK
jgi:ribosomal protein S18 acetylase RimI-like enzyme